jgi:hypothetical protein
MKRNVEREKEEVFVRLIYKETWASTSSAFNLIVFRDTIPYVCITVVPETNLLILNGTSCSVNAT